mmetsp:Transcript_67838/g.78850  ORF Transcript_67838/g.78850 Transcript_67838/m.78850 type:complete len:231 (+) Transcript_67838:1776-2468(+)
MGPRQMAPLLNGKARTIIDDEIVTAGSVAWNESADRCESIAVDDTRIHPKELCNVMLEIQVRLDGSVKTTRATAADTVCSNRAFRDITNRLIGGKRVVVKGSKIEALHRLRCMFGKNRYFDTASTNDVVTYQGLSCNGHSIGIWILGAEWLGVELLQKTLLLLLRQRLHAHLLRLVKGNHVEVNEGGYEGHFNDNVVRVLFPFCCKKLRWVIQELEAKLQQCSNCRSRQG